MTLLERYIEQANPHEAGHILVGRTLGVPIFGLDHIVLRGPNNEVLPGHFIPSELLSRIPASATSRLRNNIRRSRWDSNPPAIWKQWSFAVQPGLLRN